MSFLTWARGPQPGEFLAFGDSGRSEWLIMFRGIRTTVETLGPEFFRRSLAPDMRRKAKPLPPPTEPFDYEQPLANLREYITYNSTKPMKSMNLESLEILLECYRNRYEGVDSEYHVSFAWMYRMSEEFLNSMQRHDAIPLIIYAHFLVLMWECERFWYLKGWTWHVMSGIWDILRDEDRVQIRWPCATVGWIPG